MKGKNHFTSNRIKAIEAKVEKIQTRLRPYQGPPEAIYLDSADLLELFSISVPTLRYWRKQGLIEATQIKGKFFYQLSEVILVIERHRSIQNSEL